MDRPLRSLDSPDSSRTDGRRIDAGLAPGRGVARKAETGHCLLAVQDRVQSATRRQLCRTADVARLRQSNAGWDRSRRLREVDAAEVQGGNPPGLPRYGRILRTDRLQWI